uniref:Proteasome assembly chaperone 2 n=1 Tax=Papio anubis TaxID=9555 RepID=A0A8I5N3Y1_PAPAN
MFVLCGESAPDLAGFTLLMPAVSVGNVGQLAMDLIISTLSMSKIGYFYTDCLVPMVGNNPYATAEGNSTELSINAEVYSLPSRKLVALQLRSIFIKYKSKPFLVFPWHFFDLFSILYLIPRTLTTNTTVKHSRQKNRMIREHIRKLPSP